jgi:hypothetical protein
MCVPFGSGFVRELDSANRDQYVLGGADALGARLPLRETGCALTLLRNERVELLRRHLKNVHECD